MKIALFTTSDCASRRGVALQKLVESLSENELKVDLKMYLLLQNYESSYFSTGYSNFVEFITLDKRCSISAARNIMMEKFNSEHSMGDDIVFGFPDDDCHYDKNFLYSVVDFFNSNSLCDLLIFKCKDKSEEWNTKTDSPRIADVKDTIRNSTSNVIFIRSSILRGDYEFDTSLGLGSRYNGGEDTDYAIRAYLKARRSYFLDKEIIGHRKSNFDDISVYYTGTTIAIGKHLTKSFPLFVQFIRKIIIGLILIMAGKLQPTAFYRACKAIVSRYLHSVA